MKKNIISLLYAALWLFCSASMFAQQDSLIYQEESIEESDYRPRIFSWSWRGKEPLTVTPHEPPASFRTPDIYLYFDGKEFDRRIRKLEEDLKRTIEVYRLQDIRRELKLDSLLSGNQSVKIIIKKPRGKKEIIVIPDQELPSPKKPNTYQLKPHKNRRELESKLQKEKKRIQELENKIERIEKRIQELEQKEFHQK